MNVNLFRKVFLFSVFLVFVSISAYHLYGNFGEKFPSNGTGIFLATVQPLLRQTEKFITYITGSPGTLPLKHIVRTSFSDNRNHLSNRICNYLLNITRYTMDSA